jgi:hypothetical protein
MSADEEIGNEIGTLLLIVAGIMIGAIALVIYAWHHVNFSW